MTIEAPMTGTVTAVLVGPGDTVRAGRPVIVLESMKMEHEVVSDFTGTVSGVAVSPGDVVNAGDPMVAVVEGDVEHADVEEETRADPTAVRADLAEGLERQGLLQDAARPDAVARRRRYGHRTARENLTQLCDPGTFIEYGGLAVAE